MKMTIIIYDKLLANQKHQFQNSGLKEMDDLIEK